MTREQSLKREASDACGFRKHTMSKFKTIKPGLFRSVCLVCGMYVDVNLIPLPNDIEIGGAAGQESFEYFNMAGKKRIQYDYRTPAGLLFSTIAPSLEIAQERRDKWLRTLPQS